MYFSSYFRGGKNPNPHFLEKVKQWSITTNQHLCLEQKHFRNRFWKVNSTEVYSWKSPAVLNESAPPLLNTGCQCFDTWFSLKSTWAMWTHLWLRSELLHTMHGGHLDDQMSSISSVLVEIVLCFRNSKVRLLFWNTDKILTTYHVSGHTSPEFIYI